MVNSSGKYYVWCESVSYTHLDVYKRQEDWIEFYNPDNDAVDISGWKFVDDDITNQFIFPGGTILGADDYLVLCRDTVKFKLLYPNQNKVLGNINFGLSSDGDHIMLKDNSGNLIDEVTYSSSGLWTPLPLSLIHISSGLNITID